MVQRRLERVPLLLGVVVALLLASSPSLALESEAPVRIDGRVLFEVGAAPDADAASRARRIEQRLEALLANPSAIGPVSIVPVADGDRSVVVGEVPVVTLTTTDAADNASSIDALAGAWAAAIERALSESQERRASPVSRFVAEVQVAVGGAFGRLTESVITVVPRLLAAALLLGLFGLIAAAARRLMRFIFVRLISDLTLENLIRQVTYYAVWFVGIFVAADALGFEPSVVITGLGLTGLVLGFALRDVLSNFVAGLLLLFLRPLRIGDQIVVGETEGTVERIELRATKVRAYDGRLVLLPNAEVFTSRIINNTADPIRRGTIATMLEHDTDLRAAATVFTEAASATEGVLPVPPPTLRVTDLSADGLGVELRYWTDSRRSDFVATTSAIRQAMVDAARSSGIRFPDPTITLTTPESKRTGQRPAGVTGP